MKQTPFQAHKERMKEALNEAFDEIEEAQGLTHVNKHLTLDHIVGQPEAKKHLSNFINRVKYSSIYEHWGLKKPKALALTGPPGVGKTHSVRCLANEIDCALMELTYEDIASHLYDDSISKLDAFKKNVEHYAEIYGHVLVFIDEADSFFQSRFENNAHASDKKKTNFFLRWIDGDLESSSDFTIIASSNAWETIDPALRRSGRFTEIKYFKLTEKDIEDAFKVHVELAELAAQRKLFSEINFSDIPYLDEISGADVHLIVSNATLEKANAFLELHLKNPEADPSDFTITTEDLVASVLDFKHKNSRTFKRLGFGKH